MKPTVFLSFMFILLMGCKEDPLKTETTKNIPKEMFVIDDIIINAPKTEQNLSLFILTGKEGIAGESYKILSEAMNEEEVTVKETGSVNKLSIDNNSSHYVFIHSGDIVKGGKQDRTISYDVIVPPKTKNIPLESFCVEQGRWKQRSNENVNAFSSNTKMLSSRDLKLAAKHEKNQSKVWSKVTEQKNYLNKNLSEKNGYDVNVAANESNSSLQLALESKELKKSKDSIFKKLKGSIDIPDAIGYAYAINGEIYGVEVYNNKQLFNDLWDKILESIIVEAISKEGEDIMSKITKKEVLAYMNTVKPSDKKVVKKLNEITNLKTIENKNGNIIFSTEDLKKQKWVHKSYMKIDTTSISKGESLFNNSRLNLNN